MKITLEQQKQSLDFFQELISKAWSDNNFKEKLISNPKKALSENTTIEKDLLEKTNIVVEDQSDSSIIYLNIPRKVDIEDFELSEESLELISGGIVISGTAFALYVLGGIVMGALGYGVCAAIDS